MSFPIGRMDEIHIVPVSHDGPCRECFRQDLFVGRGVLLHLRPLGARNGPVSDVGVHWRFFFHLLREYRRSQNDAHGKCAHCKQYSPNLSLHD
jgi:hypothetical protein